MDTVGDGHIDYSEFGDWFNTQLAKRTSKKRGIMTGAITMLSAVIEKQKEDSARKEANSQIMSMMQVFEGLNRSQLKILYDTLDADGNGILDQNEVTRLVWQVLKTNNVSPLLVQTAFDEMDYDGSCEVDCNELCNFFGIV